MAPSTGFFFHTNTKPPRKSLQCHSALDFARTGFTPTIRNIAAISSATAMPYDQSMPRISVSPATAGPAMVAMVNSSVLKEMAPDNNSLGTRLGTMACPAGAQKARPTPNNAAMKNSRHDLGLPRQREDEQRRGGDQLESVGQRDDEPPVEAVGDLPAWQQQHDERQELREADVAEIGLAVRQLPHLVAEHHVDHLPGQRGREPAVRVAREIGMAQRLPGRRKGIAGQSGEWGRVLGDAYFSW